MAVVTGDGNASSSYLAEIMRAEGLNLFSTVRSSNLSASTLADYNVVVLGQVSVTDAQATALSDWVDGGGNLIMMRPDSRLLPLAGLTAEAGTVKDGYVAVDSGTEPGAGITTETMQFHGDASRYTLNGATSVAGLYTTATTSAGVPAVTWRPVGSNGGQVAVFAYDLARSVIATRQGNLAWAGQDRDGMSPNRSNDLFYGGAATDWVDLTKAHIPQADEQQRLLANLVTVMARDTMPVPRFWYFPNRHKAVVVATGDDHGNGGTKQRFATYDANSAAGCSVALWECLRFSSYIYPGTPLSDTDAVDYDARGFEIGLHPQNGCNNFPSLSDLSATYTDQIAQLRSLYPTLPAPRTGRYHCIVWSDWASQAKAELAHGIRLDTNYYYYPGSWIADRPGYMNGSGLPMRFTDDDGSLLDVYQTNTVMTDESGQSYPYTPNTLLDRALGPEGYYGAFTANLHTDNPSTFEDTQVVASARERGVPLISARQLLTWLDGREGSSFSGLAWNAGTMNFTVSAGAGASGLTGMLPTTGPSGRTLATLTRNGSPVSYTTSTVKGQEYALFTATAGTYAADYATAPMMALSSAEATGVDEDTATISWSSDVPSDSTVLLGTTADRLDREVSVKDRTTRHRLEVKGLAPGRTYHYRVSSLDAQGNRQLWPAPGEAPATFRTAPLDQKPPVISDVEATSLPDGTMQVRWRTDEPATSRVAFGTAPEALDDSRHDDDLVTEHLVVLTGLRADTTYWLRLGSTDRAGNPQASSRLESLTTSRAGLAVQTIEEFRTGELSGGLVLGQEGLGSLTLRGASSGTYESMVLDAGARVDWTGVVLGADLPRGTSAQVSVRTGLSSTPDSTWTSWTAADTDGALPDLPGRFVQFRVQLGSTGVAAPSVHAVGITHNGGLRSSHWEVPPPGRRR